MSGVEASDAGVLQVSGRLWGTREFFFGRRFYNKIIANGGYPANYLQKGGIVRRYDSTSVEPPFFCGHTA